MAPLEVTLAYHERTKHFPGRSARSLGFMDWDNQPEPFRSYLGATLLPLDLVPVDADAARAAGAAHAAPGRAAISQLFQDALGLSAWKQAGASRWALRVNPSSGNLHPTEGYLIAGPVSKLHPRPAVYHYSPYHHALELRAELPEGAWEQVRQLLPDGAVLVGLSSIHWRESWKYGERAFRYCQHDVGHAVACLSVASARLGWVAQLLETVLDEDLASLLGVRAPEGIEAEHPDCLLAVYPRTGEPPDLRAFRLPEDLVAAARDARWSGEPNRLSRDHQEWPVIDEVAAATRRTSQPPAGFWAGSNDGDEVSEEPLASRALIHQRRSAVAMDGHTQLEREAFYAILQKLMPVCRVPFGCLQWRSCIDLLLFVHRVRDLAPGLYVLPRDSERSASLREAMDPVFDWSRPEGCPETTPLLRLEPGDARRAAQQTSCGQDIASDGVFAVALLADYRRTLEAYGPWFYRRLHWEAGAVGQVLYLEAEAHGVRGTGIGCFLDDLTHELFGLSGDRFQVLYQFTVGGPLEDNRLQTLPPYAHLGHAAAREGEDR